MLRGAKGPAWLAVVAALLDVNTRVAGQAVVGVVLNLAVFFAYHVLWPKGFSARVQVHVLEKVVRWVLLADSLGEPKGRPFRFELEERWEPELAGRHRDEVRREMHAMFAWSLGDKAKEHLGPSTLKE